MFKAVYISCTALYYDPMNEADRKVIEKRNLIAGAVKKVEEAIATHYTEPKTALLMIVRGMDGAYSYKDSYADELVLVNFAPEAQESAIKRIATQFVYRMNDADRNAKRYRTGTANLVIIDVATGEEKVVLSHKGNANGDYIKSMPWH